MNRVLEGIRARSRVMLTRREWITKGQAEFAGRRLLYVLPIAEPGGGGNVILCEANAMREMGVEVAIFNLSANRPGFERGYPGLTLPVVFGGLEDLAALAGQYDAVIATVNFTVGWLAQVTSQSGRPVRGYYIQGFEPYIYAPGSQDYQKALSSYSLLPDLVRFTKTEWTRQEVASQAGVDCALVGVSVDVDLFRPRPRTTQEGQECPVRVVAMVRPSTPYREPKLTMQVLQQAAQRYGSSVEIVTFGTAYDDPRLAELPHDFQWKTAGILSPEKVAVLLNEADIFVDFSSHQAMGLTALEAMACGVAVIVPQRGGATTFVRDEENGLVVDTGSLDACWQAVQRLIDERDLRARLQASALIDAVSSTRNSRRTTYCMHYLPRPKTAGTNEATQGSRPVRARQRPTAIRCCSDPPAAPPHAPCHTGQPGDDRRAGVCWSGRGCGDRGSVMAPGRIASAGRASGGRCALRRSAADLLD